MRNWKLEIGSGNDSETNLRLAILATPPLNHHVAGARAASIDSGRPFRAHRSTNSSPGGRGNPALLAGLRKPLLVVNMAGLSWTCPLC